MVGRLLLVVAGYACVGWSVYDCSVLVFVYSGEFLFCIFFMIYLIFLNIFIYYFNV